MDFTRPIYWHEGMLLRPQHFQQQDRYHETLRHNLLSFSNPWYWGIVDLKINGKKVLSNFDLYNNPDVITEEVSLGRCQLKKGANKIEVLIVGANPDAIKSYMFGIDYLLIK